jgi:hypothetical protein
MAMERMVEETEVAMEEEWMVEETEVVGAEAAAHSAAEGLYL